MTIAELVQSAGWKNFMAKLYGIGAAVVIVGALFKIMHWPGANVAIIAGLGTEAIIFLFSAFEPPHEELDWTLVYPELAGMTDPEDIEDYKDHNVTDPALRKSHGHGGHGGHGGGAGHSTAGHGSARPQTGVTAGVVSLPGIDDQTIESLKSGLTKLSESVGNLSNISDASIATTEYFNNLQKASLSVKGLGETFDQAHEGLKESSTHLNDAYLSSSQKIKQSGENMLIAYESLTKALESEGHIVDHANESLGGNLQALNKSLSALNVVYELQLTDSNNHLKESRELYKGLDQMTSGLKESIEETLKYKDQISKLSSSLLALNEVYGNMLSAVSFSNQKS
ncbi:MAG: gliding motility protein GldL [Bacteroidales bacterium]|nr:gliding motility protein GldL [Bacteroidales bacterium]